jgi:3-oxoacyl-[acyl-carrier protein] reductase
VLFFTKAVLPYIVSKGSGVILNVNSGAGKVGFSNLSAYCASKFGLVGLAESLALEGNDSLHRVSRRRLGYSLLFP